MKYKLLTGATVKDLEIKINNLSETHRPEGPVVVDRMCRSYIQTMVEK